MITSRNDYKYVAGDLFARSAATGDYLIAVDGSNLLTRDNGLVRGEDVCWIWECINTRRAALSYSTVPYQFSRAQHPFAHYAEENNVLPAERTVIDDMVSAFNALLTARNFVLPPGDMAQTVWHHRQPLESFPTEILLPNQNALKVSMPQRHEYRHTPYDVMSAMSYMESVMGLLCYCRKEELLTSDVCDLSGFTTRATVSVSGNMRPEAEADLERRYRNCIQAYYCYGWDTGYWYANIATTGTIRITLPYAEHIKAVYPIYRLLSQSFYFASFPDGHPGIREEDVMTSLVVSTTPRTMDANHVVEISPAEEIMQACPLPALASEMNLQHGFSQKTPTNEFPLNIDWYIKLNGLSLIIELDESVS